jgi:hypothetical protein
VGVEERQWKDLLRVMKEGGGRGDEYSLILTKEQTLKMDFFFDGCAEVNVEKMEEVLAKCRQQAELKDRLEAIEKKWRSTSFPILPPSSLPHLRKQSHPIQNSPQPPPPPPPSTSRSPTDTSHCPPPPPS